MGHVQIPCFNLTMVNPNEIWQTDNILTNELPLLVVQICFTVMMYQFFFFMFKPFHQPRIISQIAVGFLLTPPILRNFLPVFGFIFPVNGVLNVEVLSHIGLIYYAFLSGLEMNLNIILHLEKKGATIAIAGIIFPTVMGPILYHIHRYFYDSDGSDIEPSTIHAYLLWTLVLTVTGFPVIVHTLSELKLLYTGLGKIALTSAMIGDTFGWILFTLLVPFSINGKYAVYSVLSTMIFILICLFAVRPLITPIIDHKTERDEWDENQLLFVVMGLFLCSYITDILGTHGIVGAFVYGLILPHGKFADTVTSISDDFGNGFLAPLFFSGTGMRLMVETIFKGENVFGTLLVIVLLFVPKILGTLFVTSFFGMRTLDGFALGLLLNTKGAMALIMLNIAWDRSIISIPTYAVITSSVLLMTVAVSPIINAIYKPRKRFEQNKLKTIQKLRANAELRILACIHNARHATSMIHLIELFNATRLSPIHVFALYLVELTGRATALVASHMVKLPGGQHGAQNLTKSQAELESISNTFDAFGDEYDAIRVQTLNVVSAYTTIHEDIYNSANENRTSLILLPFHKHLSSEGALEITSSVYRDININIIQSAPCSVGIFVDRDIGSSPKMNFRIFMLFVGGPDDREALSVAWRMAEHPGIQLSVMRMLLFDDATEVDTSKQSEAQGILSAVMDSEKQRELDDEYINSFRLKAVNNEDFISYSEVDVHAGEDIPLILNDLETNGCDCDLYIVGQGNCRNSRVFSNLLEWCDCSELGVIGDILASNNSARHASVLVVQQYGYGGMVLGKQAKAVDPANDGFDTLVEINQNSRW